MRKREDRAYNGYRTVELDGRQPRGSLVSLTLPFPLSGDAEGQTAAHAICLARLTALSARPAHACGLRAWYLVYISSRRDRRGAQGRPHL
eukprot:CAMPEP_0181174234 /NCGR_PEP_ID=MMETSP1096-20121128/3426_1 /TAXON_ID=156174 ORGANISM="Chrysochromulina ericina, Strain CCMP281" /NCGR_SAMPLE_ID=MMETSP1096 /ASSEMBLY_ACC=CAM_ASM_000453 /LENGTH=89 /DNA_ID=CAMNT_0023262119 /DNA_START=110 /DNA_END=379 /DNA_ORIENTATION=-